MSKKNQRRKAERRSTEEARRITVGKMVRLLLKSLGFAILLTIVVMVLQALHVKAVGNFWVQMGMVFAAYLIVYPVLMSEFRPKKQRRGAEEEA
ncbi:MAG TPA: hypothetical protein VKB31_10390 [Trueperaceae bacterium]|nr:hypothetical protein [Trueperaceae bacterium]